MTKILIMPDSYKETLSSAEVSATIRQALVQRFPQHESIAVPMADGGEGTAAVFGQILAWVPREYDICNLQGKIQTIVVYCHHDEVLFDVASIIGLNSHALSPMTYSSREVGHFLRRLISDGFRKIYMGLGGSATVDGGVGLLAGFGYVFSDADGEISDISVAHIGDIVSYVAPDIDWSTIELTCLTDVNHVICGPHGATYTFGRQKGLSEAEIVAVDEALCQFYQRFKPDLLMTERTGAAGGISGACLGFLHAKVVNGVAWIFDRACLLDMVRDVDLVIIGEGRMDEQSLNGKLPMTVKQLISTVNERAIFIAINGKTALTEAQLERSGIHQVFSCVSAEDNPSLAQLKCYARQNLQAACRACCDYLATHMFLSKT